MAVLITGGTGFIGSELARLLIDRGEDVVLFDVNPNPNRVMDILKKVRVVEGNLAYSSDVYTVIKSHNVNGIYHLGSMLSIPSNKNPWASFQANVVGTVNVLEAARILEVETVAFSSSTSSYGLGIESICDDQTIQRPVTMYGCGKLYCELVGAFYRNKFKIDFRSIRLPSIIGPGVDTPGIAQYNTLMIEHAINRKNYECYVEEDTKTPIMYYKDAARAMYQLFNSPSDQIKTINYNCSGVTPLKTAKELETTLQKYFPNFQATYNPDQEVMKIHKSRHIDVLDDSRARDEWGWQPGYRSLEDVVESFIEDARK